MTTRKFKKGDLVTLFRNWDDKGTVQIRDLTVYSCGAKQMVLLDDAGNKFSGTFWSPNREDRNVRIRPRMTPAQAESEALEMAAACLAWEREHIAECLRKWGDSLGYRIAMEKSRDALHEPRALRSEG